MQAKNKTKVEARLTHYERALSKVQNIKECKRWAKIAITTANPAQAFFNLVEHFIERAPNKKQAQRIASYFSTETIGYFHALVLEWAKKHDCCYYKITTNEVHFAEFLHTLTGGDQAAVNVGGQMAYQLACHELHGKRVYSVTSRLAELLLHTELKGLTTEDLKLPERSIYIQVPLDTPLKVHNVDTGWHPLEGIYITEDKAMQQGEHCWRFLAIGAEKSPPVDLISNDALAYWRVDLPPDTKLDTVIKQSNHQMRIDTNEYQSPFEHMWDEWSKIFTFAMNVVIYATWPSCERENIMANPEAKKLWERVQRHPHKSSKRSKAQQAFAQVIPMRRTVLDSTTTVDRSRDPSKDSTGTGQPLLKRIRVHGHWKRQAIGKGSTGRKWIWIQPYWRGPTDGEEIISTHQLK